MQDGRQNNETMQKEGVLINDSIGKIALGAIRRINETIHFAVRRINKTISRFAVAIERNKSALDARTNRAAAGDAQQRNIYREIANFIAVSRLQTFESDLDADGTKVDLAKNKTGTGLENNRFTRPLSVDASDDVQRQREKQTFIDHRLQQAPKITDLERATAARPKEPQLDPDQDMKQ